MAIARRTGLPSRARPTYSDLTEEQWPSWKAASSKSNITRERLWRPLWEKELSNIAHHYESGKFASGFTQGDPFHVMISYWLWGKITQARLDEALKLGATHRIRKQGKILLPSGTRRIDMYERPEVYGFKDMLIPIPEEDIDKLLQEYDRPDLLQFGTNEEVAFCEGIYNAIGTPPLRAKLGWKIFREMVNYCVENHIALTENDSTE